MNRIAFTSIAFLVIAGCGASDTPPMNGHGNDLTEVIAPAGESETLAGETTTPAASSIWTAYCGPPLNAGVPSGIVEHRLWDEGYKSHWDSGHYAGLEDRCFMVDCAHTRLAMIISQMLPHFPTDFDGEWWRENIVEAKLESLADYIVLYNDAGRERQLAKSGAVREAWGAYRARFDEIKNAWNSKTGPAFTSGVHFVDFVANVSRRTGTDFSFVLATMNP